MISRISHHPFTHSIFQVHQATILYWAVDYGSDALLPLIIILTGNGARPEKRCEHLNPHNRREQREQPCGEGIHQDVYAILMDSYESEEEVEKRLTPIDLALNKDSLGPDSAIYKHLAETVLRTAPGAMPSLCKCGLPLLSY